MSLLDVKATHKMTQKAKVKRLKYLSSMLSKYAHCWNENPSSRMYDWVDEYNDLRNTAAWFKYCEDNHLSPNHNAYDCMA